MKKILVFAALIFLVSACSEERMCCIRRSNTNANTSNINCYCPNMNEHRGQRGCGESCSNGCREQYGTVSEPVEVIYKTTRYRTVYEPKTYSEVVYERRSYQGESCNSCR